MVTSNAPGLVAQLGSSLLYVIATDGFGSGFVVGEGGLAVTNAHVVGDDRQVQVVVDRQYYCDADVVRVDTIRDLALLRVHYGGELRAMPLGDTAAVLPAQNVLALGFPEMFHLGDSETVTRGIVSAVRQIEGVGYVQTDAAINSGNSGGPLIDQESGKVIGVNTFTIRDRENIAYALAIDEVKQLVANAEGRPSRARGKRPRRRAVPIYDERGATSSRPKSLSVAYVLWLLFGWLGAHRMYLGRWKSGVVMGACCVISAASVGMLFILAGVWLIWWVLDCFRLPRLARTF